MGLAISGNLPSHIRIPLIISFFGTAAILMGWAVVRSLFMLAGWLALLTLGFFIKAIHTSSAEQTMQAIMSLPAASDASGNWVVYLEGETHRAFRLRGVLVPAKVLEYTTKGASFHLQKIPVWVHLPACTSRQGFVAVPSSELRCETRDEVGFPGEANTDNAKSTFSHVIIELPAFAVIKGKIGQLPPEIVDVYDWSALPRMLPLLITAEGGPTRYLRPEAEDPDLPRRHARHFLQLANCYEATREMPVCQMFALILGHHLVRLDPEMRARFRRTGLVHLLVPSGAQITFAIILFLYMSQRIRMLRIPMVMVSLFLVIGSVWFFGGIPIWRAAGIAVIALLGFVFLQEGDFLNQTGAVGLTLLLLQPQWLFDPSFQFSMLASCGMVMGSQLVPGGGVMWSLLRTLAATAGAQLLLTPALALFSGVFTPVTIFANLVMAPFVGATLALGYLAFFFSVIGWNAFASFFLVPLKWLLWFALKIVLSLATFPVLLRQNIFITPAYLVAFGILVFITFEAFFLRARGRWFLGFLATTMVFWMLFPYRAPVAFVFSTGVGTVLHLPDEGLWVGNPYWEEWWLASDRISVTQTRTGFFIIYPDQPEDKEMTRIALAVSRRHQWLRYLPPECNARDDRKIGLDYCCYGYDAECLHRADPETWLQTRAITAKALDGRPFLLLQTSRGLDIVTETGLYCVSLYARPDCRGVAVGLADGSVVSEGHLYPARGLWGIHPGIAPRPLPKWWLKGI